jgi:hypothetical protein
MYILRIFIVFAFVSVLLFHFLFPAVGFEYPISVMKNLLCGAAGSLSFLKTASSYSVYDLSQVKWALSDPSGNVSVAGSLPSQVTIFAGL